MFERGVEWELPAVASRTQNEKYCRNRHMDLREWIPGKRFLMTSAGSV